MATLVAAVIVPGHCALALANFGVPGGAARSCKHQRASPGVCAHTISESVDKPAPVPHGAAALQPISSPSES